MSETFGEYLRDMRKAKQMTVRDLAAALNLTPAYISDIENDNRTPSEETLRAMAIVLGQSEDEMCVRAGVMGEAVRKYIKRQPNVIALLRLCCRLNLDGEQLAVVCGMVQDVMEPKTAPAACPECGQRDMGQTGEYPCVTCGLPKVWDEAPLIDVLSAALG